MAWFTPPTCKNTFSPSTSDRSNSLCHGTAPSPLGTVSPRVERSSLPLPRPSRCPFASSRRATWLQSTLSGGHGSLHSLARLSSLTPSGVQQALGGNAGLSSSLRTAGPVVVTPMALFKVRWMGLWPSSAMLVALIMLDSKWLWIGTRSTATMIAVRPSSNSNSNSTRISRSCRIIASHQASPLAPRLIRQ